MAIDPTARLHPQYCHELPRLHIQGVLYSAREILPVAHGKSQHAGPMASDDAMSRQLRCPSDLQEAAPVLPLVPTAGRGCHPPRRRRPGCWDR